MTPQGILSSAEGDDISVGATSLVRRLKAGLPTIWINPKRRNDDACMGNLPISWEDVIAARLRFARFAGVLMSCFPELVDTKGTLESDLIPCANLSLRLLDGARSMDSARVFIKADHALPVAGSIKARGGVHAVLCFAEQVALREGLLSSTDDDYDVLLSGPARDTFGSYTLSMGSTGNLGLSIGVMGRALGFQVVVHMSREAKEWKKQRLRDRGVNVIEHDGDYTLACTEARRSASEDPRTYFVDDENSVELFLGYAAAMPHLAEQLATAGVEVNAEHPIIFYLPCGVGGAPGGITFAARHVFGRHAHYFFAEPVEAPCMLLGMATGRHQTISVYDIGLNLATIADGLAVSRPSQLVGPLMEPLLSGCFTVTDDEARRWLLVLHDSESLFVEPSSSVACAGPNLLYGTREGKAYMQQSGLPNDPAQSTHVIWTTGGRFVPAAQRDAAILIMALEHGHGSAQPRPPFDITRRFTCKLGGEPVVSRLKGKCGTL